MARGFWGLVPPLWAVREALRSDLRAYPITPSNLPRINESLRNGTRFRHMGTAYNLGIFDPAMRAAVEDPINRLIEGLKALEGRIDLIGVVGGHPAMYAAELQKRFPNVPVFASPASLIANLRGFQAVAQSTWRMPLSASSSKKRCESRFTSIRSFIRRCTRRSNERKTRSVAQRW